MSHDTEARRTFIDPFAHSLFVLALQFRCYRDDFDLRCP